jgi:putative aldouronate transport system permease protein
MKIKQSYGDRTFDFINYALLIFLSVIFMYPLAYILSCSISSPASVTSGRVWLYPVVIDMHAYLKVFQNQDILNGYLNTLLYTFTGICVGVIMTTIAAFPLSRNDLPGVRLFTLVFTFTMFFGGGLIPFYMVCKTLGLIDNFWVMILPSAMSMFNVFLMRTFFKTTIPGELYESAYIDGARNMTILLRIVLPLSAPIIAVMVLFYGVGYWNSYFSALIFLSDRKMYPLQLILREILIQNEMQLMMSNSTGQFILERTQYAVTIKYAVIIVASLPVLALYPFLQRYFVKGVMIGSIKG